MNTQAEPRSLDTSTLLNALIAFRDGDFSVRLPADRTGMEGKICDTLNDIFKLNSRMASEFARISNAVGQRRQNQPARHPGNGFRANGRIASTRVNGLIGDLVQPSTEVARVIGAVAKGDLSQTMAVEVDGRSLKGEFLHTARVVNTMVDQLNSFASRKSRAWPARSAPKANSAARPSSKASAASGRISPTPSTPWPATSLPRSATSPR